MNKSTDMDALRAYMSKAEDIDHWNELRDHCKKMFEQDCINQLDGSAYVKQVLKTKNKLLTI